MSLPDTTLLVYTHAITPRLRYVFNHIVNRILGIDISLTTEKDVFICHDGMKMTYTKQALGNEFFVKSHTILFEHELTDIDIHVQPWGTTKCFFQTNDKSRMPFDIFAAAFYLLSRYEEYLPHVKDAYGRFLASESIAYKYHFLEQPVIDIWAYKFKSHLQEAYPSVIFPERAYRIKPIIDIPSPYKFKTKGIMRAIGGIIKDLCAFKASEIYNRIAVLMGFKHDPYDVYKYLINKQKQYSFKFLFCFLVGDYSSYDKGTDHNSKTYRTLIKQVADYSNVGLKASFLAIEDPVVLKQEKDTIEGITNMPLVASRHSHSRVNLPESYRNLLALEVQEDYTMGYVNQLGFRAGTCTPFAFYDLGYETPTPLEIHPYHVMDYALLKHRSFLDKKEALDKIISEVKQVNGELVVVVHNYTFFNTSRWKGFKTLFNRYLNSTQTTQNDMEV